MRKINNIAIISTLSIGAAWSGLALAVPAIRNITIDQSITPNVVTVTGTTLCRVASCATAPTVSIGGVSQKLLAGFTTTTLKMKYTPVRAGNYPVVVKNATGSASLTLTAGAVGPVGRQGPRGANGAQGPRGLTGATGPAGTGAPVHVIGESYQGGIIFYVDADGQHGLIAARADQSAGIRWFNGVDKITGTTGDGIGAGAMNTAIIVATQMGDAQGGNFAAKVAADYSVQDDGITACTAAVGFTHPPVSETCYGDWYLPSKVELNLLYNAKVASVVGGFTNDNYWSSTEGAASTAWAQFFFDGFQYIDGKDFSLRVQAVRAF